MSYMQEKGFDVTMISSDGDEIDEVTAYEDCEHVIVPMTRSINIFMDLYSLIRLTWVLRRLKPDIVHTHTPKAGLLGMWAALFAGVKIRLHTIAGLPFMTATGAKRQLLIAVERLTYIPAKLVLPNSKSIYDYMVEKNLVSRRKLRMIGKGSSNGIDLNRYNNSQLDENLLTMIKSEINFSVQEFYFLVVGRMVKDKGINEVISAFLEISDEVNNVRLLLVGPFESVREDENLSSKVKQVINDHRKITHISWSNYVEYYMHISHVLIHASHREGFPNVLLQAGSMNCPIICTQIPGNVDIVEDGVTGSLFDKENTQMLVSQLRSIINNYSGAKLLSSKLQSKITQMFSREYIHEEIYKLYREFV